MSNKFFVKYFLIISILIISCIPIINILGFNSNIKQNEIYTLDNIEGYINFLIYKKYNKTIKEKEVIAGKDGFMFLGHKHNKVIDKTNGTFVYTNDELDKWIDKLNKLQNWYKNQGIEFLVVIAPNKHSIYKEKLPDFLKYDGKTITDDIVEKANLENINILDLREKLLAAKQQETDLLYLKTDTHWNKKGASIAFDLIINEINNIYNLNLNKPKFVLKSYTRGAGDLSNLLKINKLLPKDYEKEYSYSFEKKYDICKGNIDKNNYTLEKCENMNNPDMGIVNQPQYMINSNSENKNKLLFLCDSFATAPSQLYNATFNTIYKLHVSHIKDKDLISFINKNKPDIVIYQVVERGFFQNSFTTLISNN